MGFFSEYFSFFRAAADPFIHMTIPVMGTLFWTPSLFYWIFTFSLYILKKDLKNILIFGFLSTLLFCIILSWFFYACLKYSNQVDGFTIIGSSLIILMLASTPTSIVVWNLQILRVSPKFYTIIVG